MKAKFFIIVYLLVLINIADIAAQGLCFNQIFPQLPNPPISPAFDLKRQYAIATADIDNDNDLDVIMTNRLGYDYSPELFKNDGQGNFQSVTSASFELNYCSSVSFADIDNDNDPDLLIAGIDNNNNISRTYLYSNDGDGNFTILDDSTFIGVNKSTIVFADIDNDNDLDLLIAGMAAYGIIVSRIYVNDGLGNYTISNSNSIIGMYSPDIIFFDADNDMDQDFLIMGIINNDNETSTLLYLNDGYGNFTIKTDAPFLNLIEPSAAAADIDNDNDMDLIVTGSNSGSPVTILYKNDGLGNFIKLNNTPFVNIYNGTVVFSDFDNDSDQDLLMSGLSYLGDITAIYKNNGNGDFTKQTDINITNVYNSLVIVADFDNDTDQDIILTGDTYSYNGIEFSSNIGITDLYLNDGKGNFYMVTGSLFEIVENSYIDISDINNDGYKDVIMTGIGENGIFPSIYTGGPDGQYVFVAGNPLAVPQIGKILTSDIDRDGDNDILIAGHNPSLVSSFPGETLTLYINNGNCSFTYIYDFLDIHIGNGDVEFADVDRDGDPDLYVTCYYYNVNLANLYINDGHGNFSLKSGTPFAGIKSGDVEFFDIDKDNDLDLLITGESTEGAFPKLYKNNGAGDFTLVTGTAFLTSSSSTIAYGDIDNDKDIDVVISGYYSGNKYTRLYKNSGNGVFTIDAGTQFEGLNYSSLTFIDLDKDNDLDLFIAGSNNSNNPFTALYTNDGNGNFSLYPEEYFPDVLNQQVVFADIDKDLDSDLLLSGINKNYRQIINLYKNNISPSRTDSIVACDSYTWIDGITYTESNNTANFITTNIAGCDSVINLNLTINKSDKPGYNLKLLNNLNIEGISDGSFDFADVDGDNDLDILISGINNSKQASIGLYKNDGQGNFELVKNTSFVAIQSGSISFADIDGDNDHDVLLSGRNNSNSNVAKLYRNDGLGNYTEVTGTGFNGSYKAKISFVDIDNDSDLDLIMSGNSYTLQIYKNSGSGNFVYSGSYDNITGKHAVADIDGDLDKDFIITGIYNGQWLTSIYKNNGKGSFTKFTGSTIEGLYGGSISFADIDGDKDMDLLMTGLNSAGVRKSNLYTNSGIGIFTLVANSGLIGTVDGIGIFSDFDKDNDQDILITGGTTMVNPIGVSILYKNDGLGNYKPEPDTLFEGVKNSTAAFFDIDGDSNLDFVIAGSNNSNKNITNIYKNYFNSYVDEITSCKSYTWIDGITYTESNNKATFSLPNMAGCDSLITLDLTIKRLSRTDTIITCNSYTWIDSITYYNSNDSAFIIKTNIDGCDSIFYLKLTILQNSYASISPIACYSYLSPSERYSWTESGSYFDTIPNIAGCDSIITIDLTINQNSYSSISITACNSYTSPSEKYTWTESGSYFDTITNVAGCDSIITIDLTINRNSYSSISITACNSYTSPSKKYTWTESGIYYDTIPNAAGCDSIITFDLTIINSSFSAISITSCNSYTSPSGKYEWAESGTYSDTIPNAAGCDSIITIDLTINYNSSSAISITSCNSYTSPSKKYTWTESGIYYDTIPNAAGCDSIITIDLTINYSSSSEISITSCNSYTSPSEKYIWTESGTYYDTIPNTAGCDSIITVDLTISHSSFSTISITSCNSYTSPSKKYTWTESGIYYDNIPNAAGCDSIITFDLTIINSSFSDISVTSCNNYTSPSGKYEWAESGIYSDTLITAAGCDSILNIHLEIPEIDTSILIVGSTLRSNADASQYRWLNCDKDFEVIENETNISYTVGSSGNYAVEINVNDCIDTSSCIMVLLNNLYENNLSTYFSVYPNPTSGRLTITFDKTHENCNIRVKNIIGTTIFVNNYSSTNQIDLNIQGPDGIYFVEIVTSSNPTAIIKVIKE